MTDRFRYYSRILRSSRAEVGAAVAWVAEVAARHGMSQERLSKLDLCASELLANVAEHSYPGTDGDIHLDLFLDQDTATLTVADTGPPFDPETHPPRPLQTSLMSTPTGGFGLRLVKTFADSITYERIDDRNLTILRIGGRTLVPRNERRCNGQLVSFPLSRGDGSEIAVDQRCNAERRVPGSVAETCLFRGVPQSLLASILTRCELRTCEAQEVLFRAGEHHRCVLVNLDGRLEVHLDDPGSQFHFDLGPGECVGELSVANGMPVSAWIVAGTASSLLVIPEPVFLESMLGVPKISRNLMILISERMRRSDAHVIARLRAALELEVLQRELDLAREIQSSMLPMAPLFANEQGIRGRGYMRAARHVGGDFYDAFSMGDGRVFAAIGDVCNKGTPAALFMVRTLTVLRSEAMSVEADACRHLARLASRCNDLLSEANDAQQFVTLFCAIVDITEGRMYFVNAGHNPALLRVPGADPIFLRTPRNPLAGIFPGLEYSVGSHAFPPGSLCVLYTDGVTEADNRAGALFGDDTLRGIVAQHGITDADSCVDKIIAAVDEFSADQPQADDITVLAVYRPYPYQNYAASF